MNSKSTKIFVLGLLTGSLFFSACSGPQSNPDLTALELDFEKTVTEMRAQNSLELTTTIANSNNNFEIGFAKYFQGLLLINNEETAEEGFTLIEESAVQYANPYALSTLSRSYFNGQLDAEPNLEKAFFYIEAAFETIGYFYSTGYPGNQFLLDTFVRGNLGYRDGFLLDDIQSQLDDQEVERLIAEEFPKIRDFYVKKYGEIPKDTATVGGSLMEQ